MEIRKNQLHEYLRDGEKVKFNEAVAQLTESVDLADCNLRGMDLRELNLRDANLENAYLKSADMRGLDLSGAKMAGASIHKAHIGGVLFPDNIDPSEIRLSIEYGTRIRTKR